MGQGFLKKGPAGARPRSPLCSLSVLGIALVGTRRPTRGKTGKSPVAGGSPSSTGRDKGKHSCQEEVLAPTTC